MERRNHRAKQFVAGFLMMCVLAQPVSAFASGVSIGNLPSNMIKTMEFDEVGRIIKKVSTSGTTTLYDWGARYGYKNHFSAVESQMLQTPGHVDSIPYINEKDYVKVVEVSNGQIQKWSLYHKASKSVDKVRPFITYEPSKRVYREFHYANDGRLENMIKVDFAQNNYTVVKHLGNRYFKKTVYTGAYDFSNGADVTDRREESIFRTIKQNGKLYEAMEEKTLFKSSGTEILKMIHPSHLAPVVSEE